MTNYPSPDLENRSINIFNTPASYSQSGDIGYNNAEEREGGREVWRRENVTDRNGGGTEGGREGRNVSDEIINEVVKLKSELKNATVENMELKRRYEEETERLNTLALKNATVLNEIANEKKLIQMEYTNYKAESMKDIKRLQDELDKNVIMLNCLKDEILYKEEELRKAEILEKLYNEEISRNQEKDLKIQNLEILLSETKTEIEKNQEQETYKKEVESMNKELTLKNSELEKLHRKYEMLKKHNKEIEDKIHFLQEESDYYKNNENSFFMRKIFTEENVDDSILKKNMMKLSVLYNIVYRMLVYDQRSLLTKEKMIYCLEKENVHFLKKFITDEIYAHYLKDCISKINLTYQIDLHKQEKKYMMLNSQYDELYNKFLFERNENCLLNEKYEKVIFYQKTEINQLQKVISEQNKDKEILTQYIDNYITYIENSYNKYCTLKSEYRNLEDLVQDLEEKNQNLTKLVNEINKEKGNRVEDISNSELSKEDALSTSQWKQLQLMRNEVKDKDIRIIELESKNLELQNQVEILNEKIGKNPVEEFNASETLKIRELCFDLKDICSKLELEVKEKNYIIEELTSTLKQAEKKNDDNKVIQELSDFRIQNFNDNLKYYQNKINDLSDKLKAKEEEVQVFQEYNERLKEENEKCRFEIKNMSNQLEDIQIENNLMKREKMRICNDILNNSNNPGLDSLQLKVTETEEGDFKNNFKNGEAPDQQLYRDVLKLKQTKKRFLQENHELEMKVEKMTKENLLIVKENEELREKLEMVCKENVKIKNDLICTKADAEKSLFYLECEKKEKIKYKLLFQQIRKKNRRMKYSYFKMVKTVKCLVGNIKKVEKEHKRSEMNNSLFVSSSSSSSSNDVEVRDGGGADTNIENEFISVNGVDNTQLVLSSVSKSRNSGNNISTNGKTSMQSKSTKVLKDSHDLSPFAFTDKEGNRRKRGRRRRKRNVRSATKRVFMKIKMHRFSLCNNFKIDVKKYKRSYKELNDKLNYLNERRNDDLNMFTSLNNMQNATNVDTFYSIPNSADSRYISDMRRKGSRDVVEGRGIKRPAVETMKQRGDDLAVITGREEQGNVMGVMDRVNESEKGKRRKSSSSFFESDKLINDINYIKRKYESKIKENVTMHKRLSENEKELHFANVKYEELLHEHDNLINDIKERTDKLANIEKSYNLLFEKYNETKDEIKMHEQKTQDIFNECNELVEYMKTKEKKIKEFDEHINKMEIKYKEEKEKNDILTKDNVALDNLNSKYKEDIELYKKRYDSVHTELRMKMSKIEELEQNQKNIENENYYLKTAAYKYELTLKESHDELNRTDDLIVQMKKEINEKTRASEKMKEQIVKRDYLIYNIGKSYKSKEYFYKNLKLKVHGFNKTFIELCESFELSEVRKINELYKEFEYTDEDYRTHISNMLLNQKGEYVESFEDILKKVDVVVKMNAQYEREKQEMVDVIKELESKMREQMNEHNIIYEEYERNVKKILFEKEEQMNDCIILSEDLKKKNTEIHLLMKELETKSVELNEINMKCTFLSGALQNLESEREHLSERLREMENTQDKQLAILRTENEGLKTDVRNLKNLLNTIDDEMRKIQRRADLVSQEKDECEREIEKLKDLMEEEKKFNELFKENEQNYIQEIKEAHIYAIKKEEERNYLNSHYETEQRKYNEEMDRLKIENEELQDAVKRHLTTVADLETQMVEYKVLLDKNTSMKLQIQDYENKMHELIKDNEKLCVDLKKEKVLSEEKEKDLEELSKHIKGFEKEVYKHKDQNLKMKDKIEQLTEEIKTLHDIKESKEELIEQLENNLRKAVFGDVQINEMEKERMKHRIFSEEELTGFPGNRMYTEMNNGAATFHDDLVNSQMCIFNNNTMNGKDGTAGEYRSRMNGIEWNNKNIQELRKYSLVLKEENDLMKQELRKLQDTIFVEDRKYKELERIIEGRDNIIQKVNGELMEYNEKIKNLEKNLDKLNSELCASNELLALRNDECKELTNELHELNDVNNKLLVKNEVYQRQVELYKTELNEKEEQLKKKHRNYGDVDTKGTNDLKPLSLEHNRLIEELKEKNNVISEYNNNLNFYYKIFTHIMYFKKCVEKEVNTTRNYLNDDEHLQNSISLSRRGTEAINQELENVRVEDVDKISDYVNEFLKCVRLLIFKKRVVESKWENTERKYNEFKEKLEDDKEMINNLKKKIRHFEDLQWQVPRGEFDQRSTNIFAVNNDVSFAHVKEGEHENTRGAGVSNSYKMNSEDIRRKSGKNAILEEKNQLLLKFENERLAEENKYLNEQIHSLLVFKNTINEMKEYNDREYLEEPYHENDNDLQYAMLMKNKCLKLQIETTNNELNICKSKNEYLKKTLVHYEEIIAAMQAELVKIIDTQRKCDKEFYKVEMELEQKKKQMELLQRKRKEDAEIIEMEYAKNMKIEKEFIELKDENFKKETKIRELEEVIKKLKEDIEEQYKEKEELRELAERMKIKYTTSDEKYTELLNIFEKEKEDFSENQKEEISSLTKKLKKYDETITHLLDEKTTLLHKYEELKKVYAEKTKAESVLLEEMNLLEKSNGELKEKARELNDRIKMLMEENEQYNIKLFNLDKEKLDLHMKYLKASEELNSVVPSGIMKNEEGKQDEQKKKMKKKDVVERDPFMNSLWVIENEIEEKEKNLEQKLNVLNEKEKEKEKERSGSIILMEDHKENDAILEKAKHEIEDLEIENDLLKTKIVELEKLNKNVFNDNKELIRIISSFEEKEKNGTLERSYLGEKRRVHVGVPDVEEPNALEKLTLHNSVSRSTYEHLLNEHRIMKHKNENLISEMDRMRIQLNDYKNMVSKHGKAEESNKKTKNYLHYLNDKIKSFIEIFNDQNFNYDYFKKELKKMRSTNLMILEDNFGNDKSTIFKRDSEEERGDISDLEESVALNDLEDENNDTVSVDTRIIVNLFSAYDDSTYGKELLISRTELNQFYKYILKLKEHYKKKCLVVENQQGKIRALNEEVVAYAEGYKDKEQQWKNKINEILSEQTVHTEKFSKIHNTLIKTLEEEIDRNKKLVKEIDEKNEQLKRKEEKEMRMENLLQLKDADMYNEYSDGDLKHILKVQNKYKRVKEHNAQISKMNEKLLEENHTFKEAVINMKKEIGQLTEEIKEKKILLNKRNSEIEELRRKLAIGFDSKKDSANKTEGAGEGKGQHGHGKDTPRVVKEYEEVILLMEKRNHELEKQCEQMKSINEEMGHKYNNVMKAYNELNEAVKKKDTANKEQKQESETIHETDSATKIHKMAEYAYEQHIKELRSNLLQKEEEYSRLQNEHVNIHKEYEKCIKELEEEKEENENMKKIHKNEKSRMEQMEQSMQKVLSEREHTIEEMQQLIEKFKREIQELKDTLTEEKKSKECILKEDSNMYDMLNKEIEFLKNQKNANSNHIKELEFEIENLKNDINTVNDLLRDSKEESHVMKQKLMEREWVIEKMKNKMEEDRREWEKLSPGGYNNDSSNKTGDAAMNSSRTSQWEMLLQKERERVEECEKEIEELKKKNEVETEEHYKKLKELRMEIKRMNEIYSKLKHEMEKKVETYLEEIKELKICINKMKEENVEKTRKDGLIEVAIKAMDDEIETLKVEIENKNTYIKELKKQIDESKQEIHFVEEDIKAVENFIRNTMDDETRGIQQIEQIHQRMDELSKKIEEGLSKEEGQQMKQMYLPLLQSICHVLRLASLVLNDLKKTEAELKEQIHSKEKEMLQLDNTLEQMLQEANERESEINDKKKELNDLDDEIFHRREEVSRVKNILHQTQSKEHTLLIQKEKELMHNEQELRKTRDEMTHFAEELKKRKEELAEEKAELEKKKTQIEKQKKELISEYDKLFNAQKDIKIKEDKLKKIYEKIKDQNLIELLDITNDENEGGNEKAALLDKELSILNSSLSFKKISENAMNDEQINLDSIEYTAYFREFKKRIKNLKTDLSNKEKDLEIFKKTLEIERKEKEIYRMEFEKLEEIFNAEKSNVQKLEEELAKYKSDDSNIVKALKESENLVAEKSAEVVELQQKLLECSYEMSLLDKEKKKIECENGELVKEIERLNRIIQESERNISKLNKEKLHITRKSVEKIMYDGEDIKELKNNLEDANELIRELQGKNEELDKINVELKEANKEMRGDIDVLLVNIEDINDEKDHNEKQLKRNEEKYNELKALYQEKEKELKRIFQMLSEKKKKKIVHEWEKRQATLTSINDTSTGVPYGVHEDTHLHIVQNVSTKNGSVKEKYGEYEENHKFNKSSAVSFSQDFDVNEEEKIHQEVLSEKNMIIKSLNEKIAQYDTANAKQQKIIEEYKNIIDKFSNKINMFEENVDVLTRLNEFINDNNCSSEEVMDLLKNGLVYKKILIKILCDNPFYKLILLIKGCIEDMTTNEDELFSGREAGRMSFMRRASSLQITEPSEEVEEEKMEMEEENNLFFTNEADRNVLHKMREQTEQFEKEFKSEMVHLDQHCNSFENLCEYMITCYKQNDFNTINEKVNDLELLFKNIIDGFINQMGRVRNKVDCEKRRLKRSIKILKKQIQQLSHDVIKGVEESNERNVILTKEREQVDILMTENNELRDLYEKLNDDYNEKLILLQNNEYELNELKEQLLEKVETKEKTEEVNEYLKTDLHYLNTSLDYATQNLTELDSENRKNKKIIQKMEEEQECMNDELNKKKLIVEELERKLEENNAMIEELKQINDMLMNKLEVEIERNKQEKNFSDEEETAERENRSSRKNRKEQEEKKDKENYNRIMEKELKELINELKADNRMLIGELEILKNNFGILQEKKKELEDIISANDVALNKKEIELNDFLIEKEKRLEEIKRYQVKCVQMVTICFNENLQILEIRERIIALWEKEENNYMPFNNEVEEKILAIISSYKKGAKGGAIHQDEMPSASKDQILHIDEMSRKNEELIKKNEEIWKLNKYIEELNKTLSDRDYTLIKNQQIIENQKDVLEENEEYINFLKEQIKILCNNIDTDNMFNINSVNLTPELRSIVKRKGFVNEQSARKSRISSGRGATEAGGTGGQEESSDDKIEKHFFINSQRKRISRVSNQMELNFYDEKDVEIEELKLKIDQVTDELNSAQVELKKLKTDNKELIEQCEYLKNMLKKNQGVKRDLMLCESKIEILEAELKEKTQKLEAQNKTVNECVDVYVEENSEHFHKILELKKENEKYKMEIKILDDEIRQLKNDILNYKSEIKEVKNTLDQYQSTHEQLISEFSKGETSNLYYIKLCEVLKKENEDYKEYVKMEEEKKRYILKDMDDVKMQLRNAVKENNEITLDLEFFQAQNTMLKQSCNYYKEREDMFIHLLKENEHSNVQLMENYDGTNIKDFVQNLKKQINELNQDMEVKSKSIISLKYQLKEYHMLQSSKNNVNSDVDMYDVKELVNINNMAYVQNSLFIYINLFKSVLFIIKEILFCTDSQNSLYSEILKIMQLQKEGETEPEVDSTIKNFQFSKIDKDEIFQTLLKSKPLLREKLQILQLKIQ